MKDRPERDLGGAKLSIAVQSKASPLDRPREEASVVTSKQFVQYNVQQDLQAYYKEICSFRRVADDSESQTIEGKMRVAAFLPHILQGTDGNDPPKHDERLALALYDYRITLKRLSEEAEAII